MARRPAQARSEEASARGRARRQTSHSRPSHPEAIGEAQLTSSLQLRPATPDDVPTILRFIRELALYEREPDAVLATEADLLRDGFGPTPRFRCVIADLGAEADPAPAGFALFFTSYSTWRGHHGIRLEDLYVTPAQRGKGIGRALLQHLAQIAIAEGCPRLEWDVLAWNTPAIAFYERIGAHILTEWRIMRVADEALHTLASHAKRPAPHQAPPARR